MRFNVSHAEGQEEFYMSEPKKTGRKLESDAGARVTVSGRVHPKLAEGLTAFVEHYNSVHGLRTDRTAHLEKALAMYLRSVGWEIEGLPPHLGGQ